MGNVAIKNPLPTLQYSFLGAGADIAHFIYNKDWSLNTLGTPDKWPQNLRNSVNIILNAKIPYLLFWGPEQSCFYNDRFYFLPDISAQKRAHFAENAHELKIPITSLKGYVQMTQEVIVEIKQTEPGSAEIIQHYKGKIGVISEPGKGSIFYFSIPHNFLTQLN